MIIVLDILYRYMVYDIINESVSNQLMNISTLYHWGGKSTEVSDLYI